MGASCIFMYLPVFVPAKATRTVNSSSDVVHVVGDYRTRSGVPFMDRLGLSVPRTGRPRLIFAYDKQTDPPAFAYIYQGVPSVLENLGREVGSTSRGTNNFPLLADRNTKVFYFTTALQRPYYYSLQAPAVLIILAQM